MQESERTTRPENPPRARVAPGFLIALAACMAFGPSLANDSIFDDTPQLRMLRRPPPEGLLVPRERTGPDDARVSAPDPRAMEDAPSGLHGSLASAAEPWWRPEKKKYVWRPAVRVLMNLESLAGRAIGLGDSLLAFRFATLALHFAVCLAVVAFSRAARMPEGAGLAAGLVLAVHPLRAEAVHQIVGQTESLAALAMLSGLALRLRARDALDALPMDSRAARARATARVAAVDCIAFAAALGGKEHAILFPLYAMLAEAARRDRARGLLPEGVSLVCMACVAAAYLAGKFAVTGGLSEPPESVPQFENAIAGLPFLERIAPSLGILGFAVSRFFVPLGLAPDYSFETLPLLEGWRWEMAWVGAGMLAGAAWYCLRDSRRGGRGWTLVAGGFAAWGMTSNLFFPIGVAAASRLWYFPTIPLALGVGALWADWRSRVAVRVTSRMDGPAGDEESTGGRDAERRRPALALLAAVCLMGGVAFRAAPDWRDLTGWAGAVHRTYPNCHRANQVLSWIAYERREFAEGLAHGREAARVYPLEADTWVWLGLNANMFVETRAEAEDAFRRALALDPDSVPALRGLGTLLRFSGREPEADAVWARVAELERATIEAGGEGE